MTFLKIIVILHLVGLFVFNLRGLIGDPFWEAGYFYWDKLVGAGFLVWLVLYFSVAKDRKWIIRPVLLVAIFRFSWQCGAYIAGWNINNQWWLALLFILLSVSAAYLTLAENSRPNLWLSKHMNI